ncbi:MAG: hypothetical protein K0Q87_4082 [Neobacillus sp.]|jgi:hypothetical protein|nr:hypothetical protein [Neobacillus sp.]
MKLNVSIEEISEIERFILILNIGLAYALEKNILSIEEVENFLFSPYSMDKLEELKVSKDIIRLINLGCELENVERLVPDKLELSIGEIKTTSIKLLSDLAGPRIPTKKWID